MPEAKIKEKAWNKELEKEAYDKWKQSKSYAFDKSSKKPVYSIDTPPPYVNTPVHIGTGNNIRPHGHVCKIQKNEGV